MWNFFFGELVLESTTLPALIGGDFGLVLGFEIREGISWEIPQTAT